MAAGDVEEEVTLFQMSRCWVEKQSLTVTLTVNGCGVWQRMLASSLYGSLGLQVPAGTWATQLQVTCTEGTWPTLAMRRLLSQY